MTTIRFGRPDSGHYQVSGALIVRRGGLHRAMGSCIDQAICEGKQILVHCINGRHRSSQVVATALRPFCGTAQKAMNEVFS